MPFIRINETVTIPTTVGMPLKIENELPVSGYSLLAECFSGYSPVGFPLYTKCPVCGTGFPDPVAFAR